MKWICLITAAFLGACSWTPTPTEPMAVHSPPDQRSSDTLLVFLPGKGDRGADFERHGFLEISEHGSFDVLAADAHFGYYAERMLVGRLHEDVILPARARGYEHIWLLGISAGGLGANLYARAHPDLVDGVILLAPYPGEQALIEEIRAAGGLSNWSGESGAGEIVHRELWRWLKQATEQPGFPTIVLGYGSDDRFADAAVVLAERLPAERVFTTPGGHRWPAWRRLWGDIHAAGFPSSVN